MKHGMLMACMLLVAIGTGCSKSDPDAETKGRTDYVSEQEQYVQTLQQEVSIDDPDALLDGLNQATGDNTANAALVSQRANDSVAVVPPKSADATIVDAPTDEPAPR